MKLWAGRFSKEADKQLDDFNSSISVDSRMIKEDILGSIAHAAMLKKQGIIAPGEADKITAGLQDILHDLQSGALTVDMEAEDVHTFVEATLTERLGETGKRLHTARSRNDQVALDVRLYLRGRGEQLKKDLAALVTVLADKAAQHQETILPGYTHLQRAQPVTFAHHLLAYAQMFLRDMGRIGDALERMNEMPLGSGALATTTYPIDRWYTAELLGFSAPCANSLDGVSDRDFCVELAAALSLVMVHLSRFAEEIILWCSWEFRFVELDDAFSTGSSIMPQKKNPDIAELVRGKSGRVFGDLMALLSMLKGLPLAYNKDMQEDKEAVFDACDTVSACLAAFTPMVRTMRVNKQAMRHAAAAGFINATDCADYLVKKGMAFRDAYKLVGGLVAECIEKGKTLETLSLEEYKAASPVFESDVYGAIDLKNCTMGRGAYGGPAVESTTAQIDLVRKKLSEMEEKA